jgi:hypothetical protein
MKIGGIVIGIAGILLFFWHLFKGTSNPDYSIGYASHPVMSVDSVILVVVGAIFYFWGRHRHKRNTLTTRDEDVSHK